MTTKQKEKRNKKQPRPFQEGEEAFFQAFTKQDPDTLYICRGRITKTPKDNKGKTYRVQIEAVSDRSILGELSEKQRSLIGRAVNKKRYELTNHLGTIFLPKEWLT